MPGAIIKSYLTVFPGNGVLLLILMSAACIHLLAFSRIDNDPNRRVTQSNGNEAIKSDFNFTLRPMPLCTGSEKILKRSNNLIIDKKMNKRLNSNSQEMIRFPNNKERNVNNCRLHYYQLEDVVNCFDGLNLLKQQSYYSYPNRNKPLRIAFVGDSTIRRQFHSFNRVICILLSIKSITDGFTQLG